MCLAGPPPAAADTTAPPPAAAAASAAGPVTAAPVTAVGAAAMAQSALASLAGVDASGLTAAEQAECLRSLERAESMHTAARARILAVFHASGGYEDDGHGSAKTWLAWQTRVTRGAAAGAMGWMRRLAAHPAVAGALARGELSGSWAKHVCGWSDLLPEASRGAADEILLAAAAGGADLADLAALAEEMRRRTARPDADGGDDGFAGRALDLEVTFGGAGSLNGNLTPQCTAALSAVLDALGRKAGPEDTRTQRQRYHDAIEEACRRLIAAGCLPARAGQPTTIQLYMTLDQLRGLHGAVGTDAAWVGSGPGGWPAGPGADCDAAIVPVVSGHVDREVLDQLAAALLQRRPPASAASPGRDATPGRAAAPGQLGQPGDPAAARRRAEQAARRLILARAADLLSGPAGLAAYLRTRLPDDLVASVSLPLDIGAATETIPVHLRRAVTIRDRHCRFPGCHQPPAACQPHHIIPRAKGGPTSLTNLLLACTFHHLIAIHRWGWGIALHPDGTVTATSPDRRRTLHSHGPPATAAS